MRRERWNETMKLIQAYDIISVELEEVRELFENELQCDVPAISDMLDEVGKFRGKMLRPILVLLCGKACGRISQRHRVLSTVMEMVHMATLVHDDVLDEARYRRRGPTINALHGNEAAVMLGDLLISHAFYLCSSLKSQVASRLVAATANTVCEGELMQLYYRGFYDLTEDRYLEIIARKTASLIAMCCYLGAQASDADESICQGFEEYGRNLGIAFQIMDDITDLTGDESNAGKTLGTDLIKQKLTLPVIHYLQNSLPDERQWAESVMAGNRDETELFVRRLKQAGSIDYARQTAIAYVTQAETALPKLDNPQTREILLELASMIIA